LRKDGSLVITGRKKDMIIRGGNNIYPAEIEAFLYRLEFIAEAAACGIADSVYGQKLIAYVVPKRAVSVSHIKEELLKLIPRYKIPDDFVITEQIPQKKNGKINRNYLADYYRQCRHKNTEKNYV